jgi:hypothetical protein
MDETGLPLTAAHPKSGRGFSSPKLRVSWDCTSIWIHLLENRNSRNHQRNSYGALFIAGYLHVFAMQGLLCLLRKMGMEAR